MKKLYFITILLLTSCAHDARTIHQQQNETLSPQQEDRDEKNQDQED